MVNIMNNEQLFLFFLPFIAFGSFYIWYRLTERKQPMSLINKDIKRLTRNDKYLRYNKYLGE